MKPLPGGAVAALTSREGNTVPGQTGYAGFWIYLAADLFALVVLRLCAVLRKYLYISQNKTFVIFKNVKSIFLYCCAKSLVIPNTKKNISHHLLQKYFTWAYISQLHIIAADVVFRMEPVADAAGTLSE